MRAEGKRDKEKDGAKTQMELSDVIVDGKDTMLVVRC